VIQLLASEAGFLLHPQLQDTLSKLPPEEVTLGKAEALLRALGVKSEDQVKQLVSYFFTCVRCLLCTCEELMHGESAIPLKVGQWLKGYLHPW
jgi:hypothetical protein